MSRQERREPQCLQLLQQGVAVFEAPGTKLLAQSIRRLAMGGIGAKTVQLARVRLQIEKLFAAGFWINSILPASVEDHALGIGEVGGDEVADG